MGSAIEEGQYVIAQANASLSPRGEFEDELVSVRHQNEFTIMPREQIQYMDISPRQIVSRMTTRKVEIAAENHGFAVDAATLPSEVAVDRVNLNDQTVEGMRHRTRPIFCVQYHPEASPGPHDSGYLFGEFTKMMEEFKK